MRCCADLVCLLLAAPSALAAQALPAVSMAEHTGVTSAPAIEAVAQAIAQHWHVDAARIRVERVSGDEWPAEAGAVRLLGDGAGGTWTVAFDGDASTRIIVRAGVLQRVMKAKRLIARGATLAEGDFTPASEVRWGPPRAEPGQDVGAGWIARRRIQPGEVLRAPLVEAPRAVRSGETVRVVVQRGAVTIVLPGRAIGSAALGERIGVRVETGRRLDGIVTEPGVVMVGAAGGKR